jgi:hypothetical protein
VIRINDLVANLEGLIHMRDTSDMGGKAYHF